eukprot:4636361-Prymnesium_polylepis.2
MCVCCRCSRALYWSSKQDCANTRARARVGVSAKGISTWPIYMLATTAGNGCMVPSVQTGWAHSRVE